MLSSIVQAQTLTQDDIERRAAAIDSARQGRYGDALDALAELRQSYPNDNDVLYDEIVVLGWAERDADVRERLESLDVGDAPVFVQLVAAKSLRNLGDFDAAIELYSAVVSTEPDNVDARLGLTYSYADAGASAQARATLAPLEDIDDLFAERALAGGYVDERDGRWLAALRAYDDVLARDPNHRAALRAKALVLRRLLLPRQALEIEAAHPGTLSNVEVARLRADEIALQVRYGAQVNYPLEQRHAMTDRAITALDAYLATDVADELTENSLRSDRVIALADRRESREALQAFAELESDGVGLSASVLAAAGKAHLDLHEPEQALALLERATRLDPDNVGLQFALFFAYADLNRHDEALALAQALAAKLPLTRGAASSPTRQPNPDRLRAEILIALALAYADRLDEAQAHLEYWLAQAPYNADLRHELANVYRWRGWLDRSSSEYQQVLAVEPELLEARIGRAHTALERRDYELAAADVNALNETFAGEPAVEQLTETWLAHDSSELRVEGTAQESSGVTFGRRQYDLALTWLSAPIDYRYRAYASLRDAFAEFPEGDSRRRRLAAGLQYEYGRWFSSAELSGNRDGGGELGARISGAFRLDDYWLLSSTLELNSDAVPLRGHRIGLESNVFSVGARFAPDETWSIEAIGTFEDYSDGNAHEQLSARGRRRLVNRSSFVFELLGETFLGNRRRDDVPYFSPLRDVAMMVGLEAQWRAVRRYERRLTHVLRGEVGAYDQAGFPRGSIWRIAYMMPVDLSPTLSMWFGVWRNRMYYDGAHEDSTIGSFSLQVRF